MTKASIPIVAIILVVVTMALQNCILRYRPNFRNLAYHFIYWAAGFATAICFAWLFVGNTFLADTGRFVIWKAGLQWWWDHYSVWIGSGTGTTIVLLTGIQVMTRTTLDNLFLWFHNDWLQILFENGAIGLVLIINLFCWALWESRKLKYFPAILCFGAVAFFNYPLHSPLMAALGAILFSLTFRSEKRPPSL